ncbi:MAG: FlgD immunoglobulin-like domain containing protein [Candidatus Glassbacteria bacterium]
MKSSRHTVMVLILIGTAPAVGLLHGFHPSAWDVDHNSRSREKAGKRPDTSEIVIRREPGATGMLPFSLIFRDTRQIGGREAMANVTSGYPSAEHGEGIASVLDLISGAWGDWLRLSDECEYPPDLIVGDDPPDEVVVIENDTTIYGKICVVERGLLQVDGATLSVVGDITLMDDGRMVINGGHLSVIEEWLYQYKCLLTGSARLEILDSQLSFNGQNLGLTAADSSSVILQNTSFPGGFLTTLLLGQASMEVKGCTRPGEYIPLESTMVEFSDCDSVIIWFAFPDSSVGVIQLPDEESLIEHWVFPTDSVSGIDYQITVDTTSHVISAVVTYGGSELTVENSDVAALGLIFENGPEDSVEISGLVNDTDYEDYTVSLDDRMLRLVDTHLNAWNIYPFDTSYVKIENSIFGEVLTSDTSHVEIFESICDGKGGYVGIGGESQVFMVFSSVLTQTIVTDSAKALFYETSLPTHKVSVSGRSVLALLNSFAAIRPVVEDRATLVEALISLPSVTPVEALIPITGIALVTTGPFNPTELEFYELHYCPGYDSQVCDKESLWVLIDTVHNSVLMDTLGVWNTGGLMPGPYLIRHSVTFSYPEEVMSSLAAFKSVYLSEGTGIEKAKEMPGTHRTELLQNSPNPFNPSTEIRFSVEKETRVTLRIYDIRGRRVKTLLDRRLPEGPKILTWDGTDARGISLPSGVYFYRLDVAGESMTRKMLLVR